MINNQEESRILAIALSARGFGFFAVEGRNIVLDWGVRGVGKGDKNSLLIGKAEKLIVKLKPTVVVLQNMETGRSRRKPRVRDLNRQIVSLARRFKIGVRLISDQQVKRAILGSEQATKYDLAKTTAGLLPFELKDLLPPKRRDWESEKSQMDIFDAAALAIALNRI